MNKYLLSVDPSMKNTGFTLWDVKWCHGGCGKEICHHHTPILIESYSFNKKSEVNSIITNNFNDLINDFIFSMLTVKKILFYNKVILIIYLVN
ncbi:hypothetical protein [Spiroplasma endosymbiont of Virgichneumon dumeticola]|uniref:hypothetical protein n=1 Tax=Spiroplasma endosymbiont of Virgichneumon dumeticola TaxID=3139323 RepID=UPI0035C8862A